MKIIFLISIALLTSLGAFSQSNTDDPENAYPGYKLVFHDEFNTDGKPDSNYWRFEHGFVRNHEAQYYQEDNTWCENGELIIEARKEAVKNAKYKSGSTDWRTRDEYSTYTSSSMVSRGQTTGNYISAWKYGRFEVKARIPAYFGCWPAIWTLGTKYDWPFNGEVDMMEYYPSGSTEMLHANVAWGSSTHWVANWASKTVKLSSLEASNSNWRKEFHVWRMDWDSLYIKLYLDDQLINSVNLDRTVNPRTGWFKYDNVNPYRGYYQYILLNLALGGDNGGSLNSTPFPCRYEIDYVRVYQKDEESAGINSLTSNCYGKIGVTSENGIITLTSSALNDYNAHVSVCNLDGCCIFNEDVIIAANGETSLPSAFKKGMYIVNVITANGKATAKTIVND